MGVFLWVCVFLFGDLVCVEGVFGDLITLGRRFFNDSECIFYPGNIIERRHELKLTSVCVFLWGFNYVYNSG